MSTLKTKVDSSEVQKFLVENFDKNINSLEAISGGEISQGFFFSSQEVDFVIRINKKLEGFEQDKYAYEHFASEKIPIPKTLDLGKFNETFHYSITERISGKILDQFSKAEVFGFMDSIIYTLDSIHKTPIKGEKFGDWNTSGEAEHKSWKEHLLQLVKNNEKDIDKKNYANFLEEDLVKKLTENYISLIKYCPEERMLVHADFGFNNTLADGRKITGVIDWENSKYGDFLFDVAWLSFWSNEIDFKDIFLKHYKNTSVVIDSFDERILCYKLYFGIGALFFFAKSHQEGSYKFARDKLLALI